MNSIEKEKQKLDSLDIKKQNPTLQRIKEQENSLINDFNSNFELIFKDKLIPILRTIANKTPNIDKVKTREIKINEETFVIPENIFQHFHKSYIEDNELREYFEKQLKMWFSDKTERIRNLTKSIDTLNDLMARRDNAFALASLAISTFHQRPNMVLRNNQKRTGLVISEGDIAELASGEGKTLAIVLPAFLQSLTKKGVHIMTANSYLSKRDFDELLPIYEGLGVTVGYNPVNENEYAEFEGVEPSKLSREELIKVYRRYIEYKKAAYNKDITYGAIQSFAFDYLKDNTIKNMDDMVQRILAPGFAIIDEIDEALIDCAKIPYILSLPTPTYEEDMSLDSLCKVIGLSRKNLPKEIEEQFEDINHLSFEEAKYIAATYAQCELLPDPREYQELAQTFFKSARICSVTDNMDKSGKYKTARDYFRALREDDDLLEKRKEYDVFHCLEEKQFIISEDFYDRFLRECYLNIQINNLAAKKKKEIIEDPNYVEEEDYFFVGKKFKLTTKGASKIIDDAENYPDFREDYEKHIAFANKASIESIHYLNQAAVANLLMEKGRDYIVSSGEVKVLRYGIIQEKSKYSDGLHQAIEAKENIDNDKRTTESRTTSSITQLDLILRYTMSSGTTGTASPIIFGKVYNKKTVKIPRAFIEDQEKKNVRGVDLEDIKFTLNTEDKINLIIRSVEQSQSLAIKQPVLIAVSDPADFPLLQEALAKRGYDVNVLLPNVSKEEEANMIALAGRPGAITLTTEMAGRGTDIILGGDRETVIRTLSIIDKREILEKQVAKIPKELETATNRLIRKKEEDYLSRMGFTREKEQEDRESLENIGLKVISCGIFDLQRRNDQLMGRTGRNGTSGKYQVFICPSDIKRTGKSSFDRNCPIVDYLKKFQKEDGSITIPKETYQELINRIRNKLQEKGIEPSEIDSIIDTYLEGINKDLNGNVLISLEEYNDNIVGLLNELKNIGITDINETIEEYLNSFKKKPTGDLEIDQKSYEKLLKEIEYKQELNEKEIMFQILATQNLNSSSTKLIEELREYRRQIVCDPIDYLSKIERMIEDITDSVISSYAQQNEINKKSLTKPMRDNGLGIDYEAVCLEIKRILGVEFDPNVISKSETDLLQFRDLIIDTANKKIKYFINNALGKAIGKKLLLRQNDYMIQGVSELLERCFVVRDISMMNGVVQGQENTNAFIEFGLIGKKLTIESYKWALGDFMGVELSFEESKLLEEKREEAFGLRFDKETLEDSNDFGYEAKESEKEENNLSVIDKIRSIKQKVDQKALKEQEKIRKQIENSRLRQHKEAVADIKKQNVKVRAKTLIDKMIEKNHFVVFKLLREKLSQKPSDIRVEDIAKKVLSLLGDKKKAS